MKLAPVIFYPTNIRLYTKSNSNNLKPPYIIPYKVKLLYINSVEIMIFY